MLVERTANITDLNFIYGCILYGARKGHYSFDAENPEVVTAMKKEIQSVVSRGLLSDNRYALASVFLVDNKRIATMILCEAAPDESRYEIYALSVAKQFQHKGYGSQILDSTLSRLLYVDVYARCAPSSDAMKKLLTCRGFKLHAIDNGYGVLKRDAIDRSELGGHIYSSY